MNTVLWIAQIVLALVFFMVGMAKITQPREKMANNMGFAMDFSQEQLRMIGTLEVFGALGLILPGLTGILPILTPIAAIGLALTMAGAITTHLRRAEYTQMIGNIVLLLLALFVAYGRLVLDPL